MDGDQTQTFPHPLLEKGKRDRTTSVLIPLYDLGACVLAENRGSLAQNIPATIQVRLLMAQPLHLRAHPKTSQLALTLNLTGERGVINLWELQFQATMLKSEVAERLRVLCETLATATASWRVEDGYELSTYGERLWNEMIDEQL